MKEEEMDCAGDLCQWTASNLSHIAMLDSSMPQRPEYTLTDLCIWSAAMTKGQDLSPAERQGNIEILWLSGPWELTPTGRLSPCALKRLITARPEMFSSVCDLSRVARHLARIAPGAGSGAVWPEPPQSYCHH